MVVEGKYQIEIDEIPCSSIEYVINAEPVPMSLGAFLPKKNRIDGENIDIEFETNEKGIEVELIGRILPNIQVMSGYSYLDAQYQDSPAYVNGSAPMNAAKHTANGWVNYKFENQFLKEIMSFFHFKLADKKTLSNHFHRKILVHSSTIDLLFI